MQRISFIFLGPKRLRPGWRILLFAASNLLLAKGIILLTPNTQPFAVGSTVFAVLLISWLLVRYVDKRPFISLGLQFHPWWWKELAWGLFLGAFLHAIGAALVFTGETGRPFWTLDPIIHRGWLFLAEAFPILIGIALSEELLFRGYLLQSALEGMSTIPTILLTSAFFGMIHWWAGGMVAVWDAILFGIVLGLTVIRTRALWWAIGFHFAWNVISNVMHYPIDPALGNLSFTLLMGFMIVWTLRLTPHPVAKALWDKYIHPAPWPPWRRAQAMADNPAAAPPQETVEQTPKE